MSYVLVADDNQSLRHLVRDILEAAGHQVELAADGLAVLAAIEQREPHLIVLDLGMPGMSGVEVCRAIKENPFTARIPVLILTAQGDIEHKVEVFEVGADDYLVKPFDVRELQARVVALLRLVRREGDRNPSSGLPGGRAIQEEIERRVAQDKVFAICYIDLDNFKPFADTFGFTVADTVIRETGAAIHGAVGAVGDRRDFIGHIGGDDFIVVTTASHAERIAHETAARFQGVTARAVGEEVAQRGSFRGVDRDGQPRDFPLARITSVVLIIEPGSWVSTGHLGAFAADLKRQAKRRNTGTIVVQAVS